MEARSAFDGVALFGEDGDFLPMMSSSSSIVATCLFTMGSSTSAHRVSADCSSGV
jgi:hypothetical protein